MNERFTIALATALLILTTSLPEARGQAPPVTGPGGDATPETSSSGVKPPRPGERVRLTITDGPGGRITGTLRESADGALSLVPSGRKEPVRMRLADLRTLEVKRGGAGAAPIVVGAAAGLTWGLVSAIQTTSQPCDENAFLGELCSLNDLAWLGAPMGAGLGALVGWGVGKIFFPARWRSVDPERVGVQIALVPRSVTAAREGRGAAPLGVSVGATLRSSTWPR